MRNAALSCGSQPRLYCLRHFIILLEHFKVGLVALASSIVISVGLVHIHQARTQHLWHNVLKLKLEMFFRRIENCSIFLFDDICKPETARNEKYWIFRDRASLFTTHHFF